MADQPRSITPTEASPTPDQACFTPSVWPNAPVDQPPLITPLEITPTVEQVLLTTSTETTPFRLLDLPNTGDSKLVSKIIDMHCASRAIRICPESQIPGMDVHGGHCRDPFFFCIRLVNHAVCEESTRAIFQTSIFHASLHSLNSNGRICSVPNVPDSSLSIAGVFIPNLYTFSIRKLVLRRVEVGRGRTSEGAALGRLCTTMTSLRELYVDVNGYFAYFEEYDATFAPARRTLIEIVECAQKVNPKHIKISIRFRGQSRNTHPRHPWVSEDVVLILNNESQVLIRRSSPNLTINSLRNFLRLLDLPRDVAIHDISHYDRPSIEELGIWPQLPGNLKEVDFVDGVDWSE